jgi:hypothetical protein
MAKNQGKSVSSKNLSTVGDKTQFTITRFHCKNKYNVTLETDFAFIVVIMVARLKLINHDVKGNLINNL